MLELLIEKMSCPTPAMAETCCRTAGRAQVQPYRNITCVWQNDATEGVRRATSWTPGRQCTIHERAMFLLPVFTRRTQT